MVPCRWACWITHHRQLGMFRGRQATVALPHLADTASPLNRAVTDCSYRPCPRDCGETEGASTTGPAPVVAGLPPVAVGVLFSKIGLTVVSGAALKRWGMRS